jgi:hypothetical protein
LLAQSGLDDFVFPQSNQILYAGRENPTGVVPRVPVHAYYVALDVATSRELFTPRVPGVNCDFTVDHLLLIPRGRCALGPSGSSYRKRDNIWIGGAPKLAFQNPLDMEQRSKSDSESCEVRWVVTSGVR